MPPSGEKMWQTNYMETYNKSQKSGRKYSTPSRYNTPKRKPISERLEYLARPKTPATGRPKTASSVQQQNTNVTTESSKPIISFDEFNKQFSKVKFDNCGYVVHPYSCPWEIAEFGVQGKQLQLSDRDKGENKGQTILDAADSLPKTDIKLESSKEENKENTEEETEDQKDKTEEEKQDEVPKSHTPVPDTTTDKPREYHWLCWPEPQSKEDIPLRSQTSLGFHRAPTPYGGGPGDDIEDRPSSVIPGYAFGDTEDITRGPPLTYVPELKTWVNSSSQYDKDIAQSIMTTMYPNVLAPPLPPEALRPKRQMTFTYGGRRSNNSNYNSMSDPLIHYSQSWRPLYEDRRTVSRQEALRHSVPSFPQIPAMDRSKTDIKPMSNRRPIRYPRGEDYIHERSMFMTTQPSCSGHFIIHPDWVSERLGRRKIIFGKKNGQSRNGLRYGTAQEI